MRTYRVAPRHPWAPYLAALLLFALIALKFAGRSEEMHGHRRSVLRLCEDPWLLPNALMTLAEVFGGVGLLHESGRVAGATIGLTAMACAGAYSLCAGIAHVSLTGCGCFGPIDAPWHVHLLVAATVAAPLSLSLAEVRRPAG